MPNQFFSPEGDLEEYFATDYWLFEQYIGDQLWGWGDNTSYELGINDKITRSTPVQEFLSSTTWKQVSCGANHTAAIKTDGTLWTWGANSVGQLGINLTNIRSTPVQEFTSSTNWKQVACGQLHTAAIKTDGTLWSWGEGSGGRLGNNELTDKLTPVQEFTSSTNWKQVSGGESHTAATKTNGELWSWGAGGYGRLGNNNTTASSVPVQEFTSSTNWKEVSAGRIHTAAIKTDGTLWSWGNADQGRLGNNNSVNNKLTPVQEFSSSTNWKQVFAGRGSSAAIKTDGTLWVWGNNIYAGLGVNDDTHRLTPVQEFSSSTTWKQVSVGYFYSAAIKTDGTLWLWGRNNYGQLGINISDALDAEGRSTPVQEFSSSTNWKQVFCYKHTAAVKTGIEIDTGTLT